MILFLSILCILLIFALLFTILYYRHTIHTFSRDIGHTLDNMISEQETSFSYTAESVNGKLHLKLKRLSEILYDKTMKSQTERDYMRSLISDISHQIKTPLANLKMYEELLRSRKLSDAQQQEFLTLLHEQMEKLDFLLESLVKLSRLENGIISFSICNICVKEMLAAALLQIMPAAEAKEIVITVDCGDNIFVSCDKKWTTEAIFNVLDNAVKYTPPQGSVHITVCVETFFTVLHIKDSGIGIPEAEQAKIFGRFYRVASTSDAPGVGIGLFLTRKILQAQDGYIMVKSESGCGSEFLVFLKSSLF